MTGNCLKATSFTMTVKTILIVIHMKNIKSLVILGSAQINFQKYVHCVPKMGQENGHYRLSN